MTSFRSVAFFFGALVVGCGAMPNWWAVIRVTPS